MDENNTPVKTPKKKSLGMLLMILSLVLIAIILVVVIVVSVGDDPADSSDSSSPSDSSSDTAPGDSSTPGDSSSDQPGDSTPPESTDPEDPQSTPSVQNPVTPTLTETVATAGESGKITLNTADVGVGLLLVIDADHAYQLPLANRFDCSKDTTPADAEKAGFYKLNSNSLNKTFPVRSLDAFMRQEALRAFAAMVQTFESVSHTERTFLVRSYSSSVRENNTTSFVTGNAVGLYIIEGDGQLGFDYGAKTVTVDGKKMTYEAWFKENCDKYGFYYEGLIGDNKNFLEGKFLYVGSIHAAGVKEAGSLVKYLEGIRNGSITTATAADGSVWNLVYTPAGSEATVEVTVGVGAKYVVSGDNMGGFITAYQTPASAE